MSARYLTLFFKEKDLPYQSWEILHLGETNFIDSEVVIESIMNAPKHEQTKIADTLRKIDFKNGDVMHFLEFLAGALVKMRNA